MQTSAGLTRPYLCCMSSLPFGRVLHRAALTSAAGLGLLLSIVLNTRLAAALCLHRQCPDHLGSSPSRGQGYVMLHSEVV